MYYVPWIEQVSFLTDGNFTFSCIQPRNPSAREYVSQSPNNDHTIVSKILSPEERERLAKVIAAAYTKKDLNRLNDTKKVYWGIIRAGINHEKRLLIKIAKCCKLTFKIHMTRTNGNITESVLLSREYLWGFMK